MNRSSTTQHRRRARRLLGTVLLALTFAVLTACGSTESGVRGTASADEQLSEEMQGKYDKLFAGSFLSPPEGAPAAVSGKKVWLISCGRNFPVCTRVDGAFEEAGGDIIGWDVNVYDSAGDAQKTINGIRLAISSQADAIATIAADCANIKSALLEAKAAGIPVFNYHGTDCPDAPLFAASLKFNGVESIADHFTKRGTAAATMMAALLGKRGITSGEILEVKSLGQAHHAAYWAAYEKQIAVDCPDCELVPVEFTNSQVPNPAAQIWKTAVTAHPKAVGLTYNSDTYISLGLAAAIRGSANGDLVVCCGSGEDEQAFLDGVVTAADYEPYEYYTWGLVDSINQFFSGVAPEALPDQGGGSAFFDAEHKPAEGEGFEVPVDYKQIREEAWTG